MLFSTVLRYYLQLWVDFAAAGKVRSSDLIQWLAWILPGLIL